ncbi:11168_t:CDS:2 [Gigaspora rosea]|nr:11168_t:CDS:2 [Gigaspora rosea]
MQPDVALYAPKYQKLPLEIMEKIEFYITKGNMGSKQILPLLTTEFADHIINPRDLYNAVQKFRLPFCQRHGESQLFIEYLLQLKNQDPNWIINIRMDPYNNRLAGENVRKNLQIKLGSQFDEFYKEFLHTRNSTFEEDFNRRWTHLLKVFTAGMQSTQHVEVMNRLIKEGIRSTSSLHNLNENIQHLLDNEAKWA